MNHRVTSLARSVDSNRKSVAHASDLLSLRQPGAQTQRAEDDSAQQAMVGPHDSSMAVQSASQVETQGVLMT